MSRIDDELVKGCQRYLDTLHERTSIVEKQREEQRKAEEQRAARREQWCKMLYESNNGGVSLIIPEGSMLNEE